MPSKSTPTRTGRLCSSLTDHLLPTDHIQPKVESPVDSSVAEANPLESVQSPLKAPEILGESPQARGRKQKRGPEEEESDNRRQGPSLPTDKPAVAIKRLNKKDLKELNKLNRRKEPEVLDDMSEKKRSRSRSSITDFSENNITVASASTQSSLSLSNYRLINLDRQRMVFEHGQMSEQVQTRLDSIFQSHICENDKREVTTIAQSLCDDFAAACREDDSVELIYRALELMNKKLLDQVFAIRRKACKSPKPYKSYCLLTLSS